MLLCYELPEIDTAFVVDALRALANYNARTFELLRGRRVPAPWSLGYRPDAFASRIVLRDATTLQARGFGSCGELAAAYAGWLQAHGADAEIVVSETGPSAWHAIARAGAHVYDPAVIGGRGGGAQWPAVTAMHR